MESEGRTKNTTLDAKAFQRDMAVLAAATTPLLAAYKAGKQPNAALLSRFKDAAVSILLSTRGPCKNEGDRAATAILRSKLLTPLLQLHAYLLRDDRGDYRESSPAVVSLVVLGSILFRCLQLSGAPADVIAAAQQLAIKLLRMGTLRCYCRILNALLDSPAQPSQRKQKQKQQRGAAAHAAGRSSGGAAADSQSTMDIEALRLLRRMETTDHVLSTFVEFIDGCACLAGCDDDLLETYASRLEPGAATASAAGAAASDGGSNSCGGGGGSVQQLRAILASEVHATQTLEHLTRAVVRRIALYERRPKTVTADSSHFPATHMRCASQAIFRCARACITFSPLLVCGSLPPVEGLQISPSSFDLLRGPCLQFMLVAQAVRALAAAGYGSGIGGMYGMPYELAERLPVLGRPPGPVVDGSLGLPVDLVPLLHAGTNSTDAGAVPVRQPGGMHLYEQVFLAFLQAVEAALILFDPEYGDCGGGAGDVGGGGVTAGGALADASGSLGAIGAVSGRQVTHEATSRESYLTAGCRTWADDLPYWSFVTGPQATYELCMRIADLAVASGGDVAAATAAAAAGPSRRRQGSPPPVALREDAAWFVGARALVAARALWLDPLAAWARTRAGTLGGGDAAAPPPLPVEWWRAVAGVLRVREPMRMLRVEMSLPIVRVPQLLDDMLGFLPGALLQQPQGAPDPAPHTHARAPPALAVALSAGLLPAVEACLRRAASSDELLLSATKALLPAFLQPHNHHPMPGAFLGHLLAFGEPRQVASLVGTIGKLLHRCVEAFEKAVAAAAAAAPPPPGGRVQNTCRGVQLAEQRMSEVCLLLRAVIPDPSAGPYQARAAAEGGDGAAAAAAAAAASPACRRVQRMASYTVYHWLPALGRESLARRWPPAAGTAVWTGELQVLFWAPAVLAAAAAAAVTPSPVASSQKLEFYVAAPDAAVGVRAAAATAGGVVLSPGSWPAQVFRDMGLLEVLKLAVWLLVTREMPSKPEILPILVDALLAAALVLPQELQAALGQQEEAGGGAAAAAAARDGRRDAAPPAAEGRRRSSNSGANDSSRSKSGSGGGGGDGSCVVIDLVDEVDLQETQGCGAAGVPEVAIRGGGGGGDGSGSSVSGAAGVCVGEHCATDADAAADADDRRRGRAVAAAAAADGPCWNIDLLVELAVLSHQWRVPILGLYISHVIIALRALRAGDSETALTILANTATSRRDAFTKSSRAWLLPPEEAAGEGLLSSFQEEGQQLPRRCANPRCANLEGPSEAALQLSACSGCRTVSYCCRGCQQQHWRAGHRVACAWGRARERELAA
ncbi:hypothetical protein PLESTB_001604500 [Pleodorina starrii]|uniref:phytol kinase n=1 Tax=Pleodorina starrii TaxID=330485 RepID=A0A9W6BZG8_9CHLO|nr:hypothetical protein PLESTB_001604500 [Pleodorina starrii]